MKKIKIAAFAAVGLMSGSYAAKAAGMTANPQPGDMAAPAFSWTGFYGGATLGGSWAESKNRIKQNGVKIGGKKEVKPSDFIGGLMWGYDHQFSNRWVAGFASDMTFDSGDASKKYHLNAGALGKLNVKQKWNSASRVRLGYALGQERRLLPYVSGGISFAGLQVRNAAYHDNYSKENRDWKKTRTKELVGWNIGAGVDYVPDLAFLGAANGHVLLRAEYRYTDFGKKSYKQYGGYKDRAEFSQNDFRIGAAYKF